jgi:O-6-methylguanine DNA methyltransferase
MKNTSLTAVLPSLPIVGVLKLTSIDGKHLSAIDVVQEKPTKDLHPFFEKCYQELKAYLSGKKTSIEIPLDLSGLSPFQKDVLKVMKEIPYGKVASYKDLADKLESKAYQAIGSACGKNPFMLIYPCHRVVGSRDLGGFAHGLKMKKELLKLEGYNFLTT